MSKIPYVDNMKYCNKCMEHENVFLLLKLNNSLLDNNFSTNYYLCHCNKNLSLCSKCPVAKLRNERNMLLLLSAFARGENGAVNRLFLSYWSGGPNHFLGKMPRVNM